MLLYWNQRTYWCKCICRSFLISVALVYLRALFSQFPQHPYAAKDTDAGVQIMLFQSSVKDPSGVKRDEISYNEYSTTCSNKLPFDFQILNKKSTFLLILKLQICLLKEVTQCSCTLPRNVIILDNICMHGFTKAQKFSLS